MQIGPFCDLDPEDKRRWNVIMMYRGMCSRLPCFGKIEKNGSVLCINDWARKAIRYLISDTNKKDITFIGTSTPHGKYREMHIYNAYFDNEDHEEVLERLGIDD